MHITTAPNGLSFYTHLRYISAREHAVIRQDYPARTARFLLSCYGGFHAMPNKNGFARKGFDPVEFVTINLDGETEKRFKEWSEAHLPTLVSDLGNFISEDHKLGISWDANNACFIASATCKDEKSANHNCCLTARSDDWTEALLLVIFKATVIPEGKAWSEVSRPAAWG